MGRRYFGNNHNMSIGGRWSRTILILVIANVSVFLIQLIFATLSNYWTAVGSAGPLTIPLLNETPLHPWYYPAPNAFSKIFWLYPPDTIGNVWIWQLASYMFLHSMTDPWHLIFNMLVLWMFGNEVERAMGRRRFLWLYFTAGIFAGICCCIFTPDRPILGASGAIFAIEVAFAMYFPNSVIIFFFFPIRAKYLVMLFASFTVINCLLPKGGDVAHFAHLGGLLYGYLFVRYASSVSDLMRSWLQKQQYREVRDQKQLQLRVDKILEKVHKNGMGSLTRKERSFLKDASKIYKQKKEGVE